MNPEIKKTFRNILRDIGITPERALEVGGKVGSHSLLRLRLFKDAECVCLNLVELPSTRRITALTGNANDMHMFDDASFDVVVSNAMLEHDPQFWRSITEMKRVTRSGGLLMIGVPGFEKRATDARGITMTFEIHTDWDYYRFSEQAVRDVFFDGMKDVEIISVMDPPRLIGWGWKP